MKQTNYSPEIVLNGKRLHTLQVFATQKEAYDCAVALKFQYHWATEVGTIKVNKKVNRRFIYGFAELL